jgi:hypothetical protein
MVHQHPEIPGILGWFPKIEALHKFAISDTSHLLAGSYN